MRIPPPENLNVALANSRHCKGKRVKAEIMTKVAATGWSAAKLPLGIRAVWAPAFAVGIPHRLRPGVSTQTDPPDRFVQSKLVRVAGLEPARAKLRGF